MDVIALPMSRPIEPEGTVGILTEAMGRAVVHHRAEAPTHDSEHSVLGARSSPCT